MNLSQYSSVEILSVLSTLAAVGFVALYWFPGIALAIASFFRRVLGLPPLSLDADTRLTGLTKRWGPLLGITLMLGAMGTYFYVKSKPDHAALAQARGEFSRLTLPQAIASCFARSNEISFNPPVAIAWQPQALDLYVLEGNANGQMRHYSCDGTGTLTRGERYERVMLGRIPSQDGKLSRALPPKNLLDDYAQFSDSNVLALQAALDPATGALVERRWLIGGGMQSTGPDGRDFPIVLHQPPVELAATVASAIAEARYVPRKVIVRPYWNRNPQAVFALLEEKILSAQRIAQLRFNQDGIQVTLVGPVEISDQPPAKFASMSFDAYGIADSDGWTPVASNAATCTQGRTLREAREMLFDKQPSAQKLVHASFGCDAKKDPSPSGDWTLRNSDQRR